MSERHWTHDPCDREWESPETGRTVYRPGTDDGWCEICDGDIVADRCACDAVDPADVEGSADFPTIFSLPIAAWAIRGDEADHERGVS